VTAAARHRPGLLFAWQQLLLRLLHDGLCAEVLNLQLHNIKPAAKWLLLLLTCSMPGVALGVAASPTSSLDCSDLMALRLADRSWSVRQLMSRWMLLTYACRSCCDTPACWGSYAWL
jgi:hypothetical protein